MGKKKKMQETNNKKTSWGEGTGRSSQTESAQQKKWKCTDT